LEAKKDEEILRLRATPPEFSSFFQANSRAWSGSFLLLMSLAEFKDQSIAKEKARRERSKPKGKRSGYQETSLDSEREEGSEDPCKDLNSPCKRPKPTPFIQRITHFKYHRKAKLTRNIKVYEGNKNLEDHLDIFSVASEQKEWPMPVWCKMFR
nr:reverse transcriptase domain-containing protein [Tanacetum cinerariifolium]